MFFKKAVGSYSIGVSSNIATLFGEVFPSLCLFLIIGPIGFIWFSIAFYKEYESLSNDVIPGVGCKNTDFN